MRMLVRHVKVHKRVSSLLSPSVVAARFCRCFYCTPEYCTQNNWNLRAGAYVYMLIHTHLHFTSSSRACTPVYKTHNRIIITRTDCLVHAATAQTTQGSVLSRREISWRCAILYVVDRMSAQRCNTRTFSIYTNILVGCNRVFLVEENVPKCF